MKKFVSIFLSLMLVFSFCTMAFAADGEEAGLGDAAEAVVEEAAEAVSDAVEEVVEDVVEIEPAAEEEPAEASKEAAPAEEEAPAEDEAPVEEVKEEVSSSKGLPGPMKALIAAAILLAFGGVVIFLGNKKSKGPKKPAKKN